MNRSERIRSQREAAAPAAKGIAMAVEKPAVLPSGSVTVRRARRARQKLKLVLGISLALLLCLSAVTVKALLIPAAAHAKAKPAAASTSSPAVGVAANGNAQIKILLLGSDQRPEDGSYRTDVILLVVLDVNNSRISVVSFPRDLWVKVPALYEMKINQVQGLGGFEATAGMFEANFGVKPDYYVLTNFAGFTQFIDNRGGIEVAVAQTLTDDCDLPQARAGDCTVEPGKVHMNGATALWYVRSRYTSSDLDRLRREQEVLLAIVKKTITFQTVAKLAEFKAEIANNVETNLSVQKAVLLLPFAARALSQPDQIQRFTIGEAQTTPSWSWNGMWILLPDLDAIHQLLLNAGIHN